MFLFFFIWGGWFGLVGDGRGYEANLPLTFFVKMETWDLSSTSAPKRGTSIPAPEIGKC